MKGKLHIFLIFFFVLAISAVRVHGQNGERKSLFPYGGKELKSAHLPPYNGAAQIATTNIIIVIDSADTDKGNRFLADLALELQDALWRKGFDCGLKAGRHGLHRPEEPNDVVIALTLLEPAYSIINLLDPEIPYCHRIGITQIRPERRKRLDAVASISVERERAGKNEFVSGLVGSVCRYTGHR